MRSSKRVQEDLEYLFEMADSPQNVATLTLVAEMLFDVREVLCLMAQCQGVDVDSLIVDPPDKTAIQPQADGVDPSKDDLATTGEPEAVDELTVGSSEWFAKRKADLRSGFDDSPDPAGGEGSSS